MDFDTLSSLPPIRPQPPFMENLITGYKSGIDQCSKLLRSMQLTLLGELNDSVEM